MLTPARQRTRLTAKKLFDSLNQRLDVLSTDMGMKCRQTEKRPITILSAKSKSNPMAFNTVSVAPLVVTKCIILVLQLLTLHISRRSEFF